MSQSPPAVPVPVRRRKRVTPTRVAPDPGAEVAAERRPAPGAPTKSRGWCVTVNNPRDAAAQLAALEGLTLTGTVLYMVVAYEHQHPQPAEGGTPHFQVGFTTPDCDFSPSH